jgi:hypothetical protein
VRLAENVTERPKIRQHYEIAPRLVKNVTEWPKIT